jgi:hypothetical protein
MCLYNESKASSKACVNKGGDSTLLSSQCCQYIVDNLRVGQIYSKPVVPYDYQPTSETKHSQNVVENIRCSLSPISSSGSLKCSLIA